MMIENNHVFVSLPEDEQKLFAPYLKESPFPNSKSDTSFLHSSIIYAKSEIVDFEPRPEPYTATISGAEMWFDPYTGISDLVVLLDAPQLVARNAEIRNLYGVESFYETYVPHIALVYDVPSDHRKYKWFINEVVEVFTGRLKGQVLRLINETCESSTYSGSITPGDRMFADSMKIVP